MFGVICKYLYGDKNKHIGKFETLLNSEFELMIYNYSLQVKDIYILLKLVL